MSLIDSKEFKEIVELAKRDDNIAALILFGSYARGNFKKTSDVDLCVIKKNKDLLPHEFDILDYQDRNTFDILFYDNLPDYVKFRVFKEGKVLVVNDEKLLFNIRRKFLHKFRDEYYFRERQMNKLLARI